MQRSVARLRYVLVQETPVVFPDERITLLRTVRTIPEIHTEEEDKRLHETHAFHENGRVFNMCPDYGMLMADGFTERAEKNPRAAGTGENSGAEGISAGYAGRAFHRDGLRRALP